MRPGSPSPWPHAEPLAPLRAWVRERHARDDLSWVGACFLLDAEEGRYRQLEDGGASRTTGLGMHRLTSRMMVDAARRAHRDDRPTMLEAAELLFLPLELLTATRDAWWQLGSHPTAARMLLEAFGLGEASLLGDHDRTERLLAWLPRYLPGRGCGPEARALLELLDVPRRGAFVRLPGEDDRGALAERSFAVAATEAAGDEHRALREEATAEVDLQTWAESMELDPDRTAGGLDLVRWLQDGGGDGDLAPVEDEDEEDDDGAAPAGPPALALGEVVALRPLDWYAGRVDPLGTGLRIEAGLVVSSGGRPALRAEDAVVRLGGPAAPLTLRVVPPWTCVRYLPPDEAPAP